MVVFACKSVFLRKVNRSVSSREFSSNRPVDQYQTHKLTLGIAAIERLG